MKTCHRSRGRPAFATIFLAALGWLTGGCASGSFLWYRITPDYPRDATETIALAGLSEPVQVYLDPAGVAHIDAQNEEDLVRAVGFVHARSRFFEMDLMRRLARGRLSELVGDRKMLWSTTVELDLSMRGWGFEDAAEKEAADLDPQTLQRMTAYAEGVNAGLTRYRPIEYRLLGVDPEPWTIEDSYALGPLNAWSVTHNWQQEISRLLLALYGGIDRAERIYPNEPWPGPTSLPARGEPRALPQAIAPELRELFPARPPTPGTAEPQKQAVGRPEQDLGALIRAASNSWVVGGSRSGSGKPILANDPHLSHLAPSILFQQHLRAPGLDVIGVTIAGIPYVLAGHNRSVAWGMTSTAADVIDLYVERPNPSSPDEVATPGGFEPIQREERVIRVRDGSKLEERRTSLRKTRHGPLVNDLYPGLLPDCAPPVALHWNTTGAGRSMRNISEADRADSVEALRDALAGMTTPVQTYTAADASGKIATFATGKIPLRAAHRGTFPVPGWLSKYDWQGWLDPSELPHAFDSEDGLFAHSNNLMIDPAREAVYRQIDSAPSYRFERIVELLRAGNRHTIQSFAKIQSDVLLLRGKRLLPFLLKDLDLAPDLAPLEKGALESLRGWDFEATPDSAATAIFFVTYREAMVQALADEVGKRALDFLLSQRYMTNASDLWFESAENPVWDDRATPEVETRARVVRAAFHRAIASLAADQGPDPSAWRWGRLHDLAIQHPFGSVPLVGSFFNLPVAEAPGALDSVWKAHFDLGSPTHPFRAMAGPVVRMIVDLADIEHGRWILDTGNSGWPGSPHYADQHELWLHGEYLPMVTNWDEIRANAAAVLTLR